MDSLQSQMDTVLSNPVTYGVLAIFLAMYGPRLHPKLPSPVKDLFGTPLFRFAIIMLIIYMSTKDLSMSLIISIAFLIIMSIANSQDMEEEFMNRYREGYSNFDAIKEFYDDDETEFFQEGPESYDNRGQDEETFEKGPEPFDNTNTEPSSDNTENFTNYAETFDDDVENFTPYEKHLNRVVNKYKFN